MEKRNVKDSPFYEFTNNSNIAQNIHTRLFRMINHQKDCAMFGEAYLFVDEFNVAVETVHLQSKPARIGVRAVGNKLTLCYLDSFVMCDVDFVYRCEQYGEIFDHLTMYRIFTKTVEYASKFPNLVKSESAVSVRTPKGMHIYFETSDEYDEARDWDKMAHFLRLICDANYVIRWCLDRTRGFCDKIFEVQNSFQVSMHALMAADPENQMFARSDSSRVKELLSVRGHVATQLLGLRTAGVSNKQVKLLLHEFTQKTNKKFKKKCRKKKCDDDLTLRMEYICTSTLNVLNDLPSSKIAKLNRYSCFTIIKILTAYKPVETFEQTYFEEDDEDGFLGIEIPFFFRQTLKQIDVEWPEFPEWFKYSSKNFSIENTGFARAQHVWMRYIVPEKTLQAMKPMIVSKKPTFMKIANQMQKKWSSQNDLKLLHTFDPNMRVSSTVLSILNDNNNHIFGNKSEEEAYEFCTSLTDNDKDFFLKENNPLQGMYLFYRFSNFLKLTDNFTLPDFPILALVYFADSNMDLLKHLTLKNVPIIRKVSENPILRKQMEEKLPMFIKLFDDLLPSFRKFEGKEFEDRNDYSSLNINKKCMFIFVLYNMYKWNNFVMGIHTLLNDSSELFQELKDTTEQNAFYPPENGQPVQLKMIAYALENVDDYTQPWSSPVNILGRFIYERTGKVIHPENALQYGSSNETDEEKANNFPFILMNSVEKTIDQLFMFHFINEVDNKQSLKSSQQILELFLEYGSEFQKITNGGACFEYMNRNIQEKLTDLSSNSLPVVTPDMSPQEKALTIQERMVKNSCRQNVPIGYYPNDLSRRLMLTPDKFLEYVLNKHNGDDLEKQIDYTCTNGCDSSVRLYKHDGYNFLEGVCNQAPEWCRAYGEQLDSTFDASHEDVCEAEADDLTKDVVCSEKNGTWKCEMQRDWINHDEQMLPNIEPPID